MQNLRGLVGIVSVVVFIAAAIASLSIVWVSISATANQLSPALSCAEMQATMPVRMESACLSEGTLKVNLARASDIEIKDLKIILQSDQLVEFACGESCSSCTVPETSGESKIFSAYLSSDYQGTPVALSLDGCIVQNVNLGSC